MGASIMTPNPKCEVQKEIIKLLKAEGVHLKGSSLFKSLLSGNYTVGNAIKAPVKRRVAKKSRH
jgi:hypothetical protein